MTLRKENRQDQIIKQLANEYRIDPRVCKAIIDSPFLYFKYMVTSANIEDGIRIPYFGAFCQKGGYKNKTMRTETRVKILLENITEVAAMMASTLGFIVTDVESAEDTINKAWEIGDYEKINMIWEGWKEFNGKS